MFVMFLFHFFSANVVVTKTPNTGADDEIISRKSLLSRQLDLCPDVNSNYFSSYSQFAGTFNIIMLIQYLNLL